MKDILVLNTRFIITITLVLPAFCLSAQQRDDTNEVYTMALTAHISGFTESMKSIEERKAFGKDTIFIEKDFLTEVPAKIGQHVIQVIGDSIRKWVSPTHNISTVKLGSIRLNRGQIMVVLANYAVVSMGKAARFTLMGGNAYKFRYDSSAKRYRLVKTWSVDF